MFTTPRPTQSDSFPTADVRNCTENPPLRFFVELSSTPHCVYTTAQQLEDILDTHSSFMFLSYKNDGRIIQIFFR